MRSLDRKASVDNFIEKKDLVFTGGNLKGHQTVGITRPSMAAWERPSQRGST